MFRFHLVKDQPFELNWRLAQVHLTDSNFMTRKLTLSPVEIQPSDDNDQLCVQLKELMETEAYRLPNTSRKPELEAELDWTLEAEFGINPTRSKVRNYIRVYGTKEGNILTALKNVMDRLGLETKVKIGVQRFGSVQLGDTYSYSCNINLMSEEVGIQELSCDRHETEGAKLNSLSEDTWDRSRWEHGKYSSTFYGVITITCMAFRNASENFFNSLPPKTEARPCSARKMLKEGLGSDATIIAADGEKIKCHKDILKDQSDVFEAMFNPASRSVESTTGIIQKKDMSSKGVHAFLAFLYFDDLEDAKGDCTVALDLLKAAHKYNVPRLEGLMKQVLLEKPNIWFNLEAAMQLFAFAGKIPDGDTLKRRAIAALKANGWDSLRCKELLKEDHDVAIELCQYFLSGGGPGAGSSAGGGEAKDTESSQSSN